MKDFIQKLAFITTACVAAVGMSACSITADSIDSSEELLAAEAFSEGKHVVFGKFTLLQNGREARLGEGPLTNSAVLHLDQADDEQSIAGRVGEDGEFAWALQPGIYRVSGIDFYSRGDRIALDTDFAFLVSEDYAANYIGTITLETTIDAGYYGVSGTVERYILSNDCAADCDDRLAKLGLSDDSVGIALLQHGGQLAGTR